jgi:hypothetical protein
MRTVLTVLLVLLACPAWAQERPPLPKAWAAATIAADLADLGTTLYGVNHGATELNPVLGQSPGRIAAIKLGILAGKLAFFKWAHPRNPKATKAAMSINVAVGFGAAAWNVCQINK